MDMFLGVEYANFVLPIALLVLVSSAARYMHLVYFERYFKLTFEDAPVWSLLYFSFWTAVVTLLFPAEIARLFGEIRPLGYLGLVVILMVIFPAVYRSLRRSVGDPAWLRDLFPGQGMLSLEERYIFAKIGDVVFQQCVAGAMILILVAGGLEYERVVLVFLALFLLAHIYIFRTAGFVWGMHYSAYAALGGFVFPYLVIFVEAGIAYGIVFHMLFYVLSAAFFAKLPYPTRRIEKHLGIPREAKHG